MWSQKACIMWTHQQFCSHYFEFLMGAKEATHYSFKLVDKWDWLIYLLDLSMELNMNINGLSFATDVMRHLMNWSISQTLEPDPKWTDQLWNLFDQLVLSFPVCICSEDGDYWGLLSLLWLHYINRNNESVLFCQQTVLLINEEWSESGLLPCRFSHTRN